MQKIARLLAVSALLTAASLSTSAPARALPKTLPCNVVCCDFMSGPGGQCKDAVLGPTACLDWGFNGNACPTPDR